MSDTVWDIEQRANAGKPLIDTSTWTDDQRRQADVMMALDTWAARTCGSWVEDGFGAVQTGTPFGQNMTLEFECTCGPGWDGQEHVLDLTFPCVFVDEYTAFDRAPDRITRLLSNVDRRYGGRLTINGLLGIDPSGFAGVRLDFDGGFAVVQRRYLDGVQKLGRIDAWTLVGMRPTGPRTVISAAVIGERDGEIVALVMPMKYRDPYLGEAVGDFPAAAPPAPAPLPSMGEGA